MYSIQRDFKNIKMREEKSMIHTEDNNELPRTMGTCKYCGQSRIIQTIGEITQARADEIASEQCDCEGAKVEQNRERKIKRADEWAENRFINTPEVITLFKQAFRSVANHEVEQITIKDDSWTHVIKIDSDGYLNIKSSKKVEEEVDFS